MSRGRTEEAKEILKKLDRRLNKPALDKFTERLDATVETILAIHCVAGHYHKVAGALRELRRAIHEVKLHRADCEAKLRFAARETKNAIEMEASTRLPEMAAYQSLLKLNGFRDLLKATDADQLSVDALESALSQVPAAYSGRPLAGRKAWLFWYPGFVRDVAEIAKSIGVPVTTEGDRAGNQHITTFTTFVDAVEKLLPPGTQCRSLSGCAKRIDRAIKNSRHTLGKRITRARKRRR